MFSLLESVQSIFTRSVKAKQRYYFDRRDYHPIYGQSAKVDTPSLPINTYFGSEIPWLKQLNGPMDKHIVGSGAYQAAWHQRKRKSFYNTDKWTQISPYANPFIIEKRLNYLNGHVQSSRDPRRIKQASSFYDTVVGHKLMR